MEIQDDDNNNNNTTKPTTIEYYYNNKEIEAFIESDYININDGEPPRTLEFLKNREKVIDKPDFNGKPTISVQFIVGNPDDPQRKEKKGNYQGCMSQRYTTNFEKAT